MRTPGGIVPCRTLKEGSTDRNEPVELLTINVPEEYLDKDHLYGYRRRGETVSNTRTIQTAHIEFQIPSRGIIGLGKQRAHRPAREAIMASTDSC